MLESGWSHWARGGIPQARPPGKMAAQGADWQTSSTTSPWTKSFRREAARLVRH
jgi:hypothetical protein